MSTPENWKDLCARLGEMFGIEVDLNGVLFLVGIREKGLVFQPFSKEEKLDLIYLGSTTLYQEMGLTEKIGIDRDGWPAFIQRSLAPEIQEDRKIKTLQDCALRYFARIL